MNRNQDTAVPVMTFYLMHCDGNVQTVVSRPAAVCIGYQMSAEMLAAGRASLASCPVRVL